jgi:hypothetical protein
MIPEVLNLHLQCGEELATASKEERGKLILLDVCFLSFLLACNLQLKNHILYFWSKASIFLKVDILLTSGRKGVFTIAQELNEAHQSGKIPTLSGGSVRLVLILSIRALQPVYRAGTRTDDMIVIVPRLGEIFLLRPLVGLVQVNLLKQLSWML